MNIRAIACSVGLIVGICAACPPQAAMGQPAAASLTGFPTCKDRSILSGSDFTDKAVQVTSLDPEKMHGPVTPGSSASGTTYSAALADAFDAAPSSFQDQLCGLDAVFVNTSGCAAPDDCFDPDPRQNSWALRESKARNPNRGGRYIALSASLWAGGQPMKYRTFETMLLDGLTEWPINIYMPVYADSNDPDDTPTMTILAALAHEFGHVYWYDYFDANRNNPLYDPNNFCSASFFPISWSNRVNAPPQWRKFAGKGQDQHSAAVFNLIRDVAKAVRTGDWTPPSTDLDGIYAVPGSWASLFAAFTADEDFIETFKLAVLLKAKTPLQHLPLQIPALGTTEDIPGTLIQRPGLTAKLSCFPITP